MVKKTFTFTITKHKTIDELGAQIAAIVLILVGLGTVTSILLIFYFQKTLKGESKNDEEKDATNITNCNEKKDTENNINVKNNGTMMAKTEDKTIFKHDTESTYPKYFFELEEMERKAKEGKSDEELKLRYENKIAGMQTDLYVWLVALMAACYSIPAVQLVLKQQLSLTGNLKHTSRDCL